MQTQMRRKIYVGWAFAYMISAASLASAQNMSDTAELASAQNMSDTAELYCDIPKASFLLDDDGTKALLCMHPGSWAPNVKTVAEYDAAVKGKTLADAECSPYRVRLQAYEQCLSRSMKLFPMGPDAAASTLLEESDYGCSMFVFNMCRHHYDLAVDTVSECCRDYHAAIKTWTQTKKDEYKEAATQACQLSLTDLGTSSEAGKALQKFYEPWNLDTEHFCYQHDASKNALNSAAYTTQSAMYTVLLAALSTFTLHHLLF